MTKYLTEFEDRLSTVPRWCIVNTIQKQSVSDHSFRVAIISRRVYTKIFKGTDELEMLRIMEVSLFHDQMEAFSGDIASPVKHLFDEERLVRIYRHNVEYQPSISDLAEACVKVSDIAESCFFLARELSMGNSSVKHLFSKLIDKMMNYISIYNDKFEVDPTEIKNLCMEIVNASSRQVDSLTAGK